MSERFSHIPSSVEKFNNTFARFRQNGKLPKVDLSPPPVVVLRAESEPVHSPTLSIDSAIKIKNYLEGNREVEGMYEEIFTEVAHHVPSVIEDFEELGIDDDLFDERLSGTKHGVKVEWTTSKRVDKLSEGFYDPHERKISLSYPYPRYIDRILALGLNGRIHDSLLAYGHEFAHDLQYRKGIKSGPFGVPKIKKLDTELIEAQAYLISHAHLPNGQIFHHIKNSTTHDGKLSYSGYDDQKLKAALESFRVLNVLNVPQPEIADLVRNPGQWMGFYEEFSNIFDRVTLEKRKANRSQDPPELMEKMYLNSRSNDQEKIKTIVYDELKYFLGEKLVA